MWQGRCQSACDDYHTYSPLSGVSWTVKKTNESVLNKAGVKSELLHTTKARKLVYYGHTTRKQGSCLEKGIMQGTMPGACRRGRPHTAWMDNIKTWTGLSVEESIRMAEDRDKWRKYVHGVANPQIENRTQVDRYEKKHSPTHTHPDHQSSFINSVHLLWSAACSLFNLNPWQSLNLTRRMLECYGS